MVWRKSIKLSFADDISMEICQNQQENDQRAQEICKTQINLEALITSLHTTSNQSVNKRQDAFIMATKIIKYLEINKEYIVSMDNILRKYE